MKPNDTEQQESIATFRGMLDQLAAWAADEGSLVLPCKSTGPVCFVALASEMQAQIVERTARYLAVCGDVRSAGGSLEDGRRLFWATVRRLGLRPVSDFLAEVQASDVIEIYDRNFVQLFRSFNFFKLSGYTLDEVLCRPSLELFRRDPAQTRALLDAAKALFEAAKPATTRLFGPLYVIEERASRARRRLLVQDKLAAPLFDAEGRVIAIATTFDCHVSDGRPSPSFP